MSKLTVAGVAMLAAVAAPGAAAVLGPFAGACAREGTPAMLVRVIGFKQRTGTLRVQSYGGAPETYFDKGAWLRRIDVAVPAAGPAEVCVPVARPGTYAVSVRHDLNGTGKTDRADGGGMSGNPHVSLIDLLFKRKPDPRTVAVAVRGVTTVPVVLNYVEGGSFRPVSTAAR